MYAEIGAQIDISVEQTILASVAKPTQQLVPENVVGFTLNSG
jgi:hypothetical protein